MNRWLQVTWVLLTRESSGAAVPLLALVVAAAAAEIGLWFSPWSGDGEVAPFLHQLAALVAAGAVAMTMVARQAADLVKGRPRHLFSFPVSPTQVVLAKVVAFASVAAVVLFTLNLVWMIGPSPGGRMGGTDFLLRTTGGLWLGSLVVWAPFVLLKRVPSLLGPVLAFWTIPIFYRTPVAPGWLLTAIEEPDSPLVAPVVFSLVVVVLCLVVLERHLVLRQVD